MDTKYKKTMLKRIFNALSIFVVIMFVVPMQFVLLSSGTVSNLADAEETPVTSDEIFFSEVAWMGNAATSSDEWIELYNTGTSTISLDGWAISASDEIPDFVISSEDCSNLNISPESYFLLERTDDNSVSGISADCIYSGALEDGGEVLTLHNSTNFLIDVIDASNEWPAGNTETDETMQLCSGVWVSAEGTPKSSCVEDSVPTQTEGPQCGNFIIEDGEQCDDGNLSSKDGCNDFCQIEELPSIKVCKFEDTEGNGVSEDDIPVKNWGIGLLDKKNPTKTTDAEIVFLNFIGGGVKYTEDDGCVLFENLPPGEYRAVEEARNNWTTTDARGKLNSSMVNSSFGVFTDLSIPDSLISSNNSFSDIFVDMSVNFADEGLVEFYNYNTKYCGDGMVNQEWEQCDENGETSSCTAQCQNPKDTMCRDLVLAQINTQQVLNKGNGDATGDVYLGSKFNKIPNGTWFALYSDGSFITDNGISGYEDVPGLAVERQTGAVRTVLHGSLEEEDMEHVDGMLSLYNARAITIKSDEGEGLGKSNQLENGFDGIYGFDDGEIIRNQDEVATSTDSSIFYWLSLNTADDGFITEWQTVEDCMGICGVKFEDDNLDGEKGEGEVSLSGWDITLYEENSCSEEEIWADTVVGARQGMRADGSAVLLDRSDKNNALNASQDTDTVNFYSLGIGGELILSFDNLIKNFEGNDIRVVETTYDNQPCQLYPERVRIYSSQDGIVWHDLGTGCLDSEFDLGVAGLDWARYLKFVDETNPNDPAFDGNPLIDGYDIDGVEILNCKSIQKVRTETTTEGGYCFVGIDEGAYFIVETMKEGWFNTTPIGKQTFFDGENRTHVDFGNAKNGFISGIKFFDEDRDGVKDESETGLSGWGIELYKGQSGPWDESTPLATTTTTHDGRYWFVGLTPGETYSVVEVDQDGWQQTYPTTEHRQHTIELTSGMVVEDADFGNYSDLTGSIHGLKFEDVDGDGTRDEEGGLPGWTIKLYRFFYSNGTTTSEFFASATTSSDGTYSFYDLVPGIYEVWEEEKEGWEQTVPSDLSPVNDSLVLRKCVGRFYAIEDCEKADFVSDGYITSLDVGDVFSAVSKYDLDGDRIVNFKDSSKPDLAIFIECFEQFYATDDCQKSDFNGDGFVTPLDTAEVLGAISKYDLTGDEILDYRYLAVGGESYHYIVTVAPGGVYVGYDFGNMKTTEEEGEEGGEEEGEEDNNSIPTGAGGGGGAGAILLGELGGGQGGTETGSLITVEERIPSQEIEPPTFASGVLVQDNSETGIPFDTEVVTEDNQTADEEDTNGQVAALGFLGLTYECGIWHTVLALLILLAMALYFHARHEKTKEGIIAFVIGAIIVWLLGAYNCSWLLAFLALLVLFLIGWDIRHTKNISEPAPPTTPQN